MICFVDRGSPCVCSRRLVLVDIQGGVDPLEHDRLGRLNLTREGLRLRNRLVYDTALARGIPTVLTVSELASSGAGCLFGWVVGVVLARVIHSDRRAS